MNLSKRLADAVRNIPDYPKPGINFKDVIPVFSDPLLMGDIIDSLVDYYKGQHIDAVVGVEARGFIVGSVLAHALKCRFVPVRKKGKLPYRTISEEYALEYGTSAVEMHIDAIQPGWRVLVHDDLLATGGTAAAAANLVTRLNGSVIGFSFLINLSFLPGEQILAGKFGVRPHYLLSY